MDDKITSAINTAVGSHIVRNYGEKLWTPSEIQLLLNGKWLSGQDKSWIATGVTYYHKQVKPGDLVFTMRSDTWGNTRKYPTTTQRLDELFTAGAVAVITDEVPQNLHLLQDQPILLVSDTLKALNLLAKHARERFCGINVCITGSVGKTTTKEMLFHVLSQNYQTYATNMNYNHMPGVALSLTQTPRDYDFAIYEFSADVPKNTKPKALLAKPNIVVITDIQPDHMGFYPTLEDIADQKALLFEGLQEGGTVVLNRDNPMFERLYIKAKQYKKCFRNYHVWF